MCLSVCVSRFFLFCWENYNLFSILFFFFFLFVGRLWPSDDDDEDDNDGDDGDNVGVSFYEL